MTAAVAKRYIAHFAFGRLGFDPCSGPTYVVKTGRDNSTAKRSSKVVSVTCHGDDSYKGYTRGTVSVAR